MKRLDSVGAAHAPLHAHLAACLALGAVFDRVGGKLVNRHGQGERLARRHPYGTPRDDDVVGTGEGLQCPVNDLGQVRPRPVLARQEVVRTCKRQEAVLDALAVHNFTTQLKNGLR